MWWGTEKRNKGEVRNFWLRSEPLTKVPPVPERATPGPTSTHLHSCFTLSGSCTTTARRHSRSTYNGKSATATARGALRTASSFLKSSPRSKNCTQWKQRGGEDSNMKHQQRKARLCSGTEPEKGKERVWGEVTCGGGYRNRQRSTKRKIWIRKGTLSRAYYLWFTVPSTCRHPLLSFSSPFASFQPMAIWVQKTRLFFYCYCLWGHAVGVFPPPTLSQLSGFIALSLWLLTVKCCSLVLQSKLQLQRFYLGSAESASAFPLVPLLLSCVFGFSLRGQMIGNDVLFTSQCLATARSNLKMTRMICNFLMYRCYLAGIFTFLYAKD
ncbi:hypothetical protein Pelo_17836 [Pelomyxa schiedti]|nr:hypothetical protein Pelo_17836 [Pelomyxa schiedti]